uniref:Uncharacterized protein n=1 Tax=Glossina austeni TaxID=7395 RepID=A0A1A9UZV7_GLOAU
MQATNRIQNRMQANSSNICVAVNTFKQSIVAVTAAVGAAAAAAAADDDDDDHRHVNDNDNAHMTTLLENAFISSSSLSSLSSLSSSSSSSL